MFFKNVSNTTCATVQNQEKLKQMECSKSLDHFASVQTKIVK